MKQITRIFLEVESPNLNVISLLTSQVKLQKNVSEKLSDDTQQKG